MNAGAKVEGSTVRLTCRYSNGVVKNYVARAVSLEGQVLQVISAEGFEPGISLSAMAEFLTGRQTSQVIGAKRDPRGSYLLELLLEPPPVSRPAPAKAVKPRSAAKAAFSRYATQLADKLTVAGKKPYRAAAFDQRGGQHGFVAATAAAVLLLLSEKNQVDAVAILERVRKAR